MKTKGIKLERLIPCLGIALVACGLMGAATYLNLHRKNQAAEASMATIRRLFQEQQLSVALKRIHDGDVAEAAKGLDLLLCGDILLTNAELPTADPETRTLVQNTFRRIAQARPKTYEMRFYGGGGGPILIKVKFGQIGEPNAATQESPKE